ncbi:MAG: ThuA domain-containing protein, partial [Bryobacterales bacterium]|nr:ThuA domain-containing protein [Bryobacterales bacterium]
MILAAALALRVLVITGGHAHDTSFYELFAGHPEWKVTVDGYPSAYRGDLRKKADVIVLYDMPKTADEAPGRERLREFAEAGRGIVALHHSLCAHMDWPWYYQQLLGGGCVFTERPDAPVKSTYWHDEKIALKVAAPGHPVTEGLPPAFTLTDETYHKLWMAPPGENRALLT